MFHSVRTKIIATFIVALIVLSVVFVGAYYWYSHDSGHKDTDLMGHTAANACAYVVSAAAENGDSLSPDSETYEYYHEYLRNLCREMDMAYLYAYECDLENNTVTYIISAAADDETDKIITRDRGYGTVVDMEFSDAQLLALADEDVYKAVESENEFGHMLDWFSIVDEWDGKALAGAGYSVNAQRERILFESVHVTLRLTFAMLILMVVQLVILRRNVFKPLSDIAKRMRSFSAEHASEFEPLGVYANDEMGEISEAFEGMATDIRDYVDDIERMTKERVQMDVELDVANRIQRGMVPESEALENADWNVSAFTRPARAVGGDFYDCVELEGGRIAAIIGDVSGKGVASALFMAVVKTMIGEELIADMGPADLLNQINEKLCQSNPEGMFATVFIAVLEPATGNVRFANAGHLPPIVVGSDVRELQVDPGVLLGLFEDAGIQEGEIQLAQGEALLLYTDGATEAINVDGTFLGMQHFAESLQADAPYATASALVDKAVSAVDAFCEGREQFDDLTFVACVRRPGGLQEVPVSLASFSRIRAAIMAGAIADADKRRLCLACEEAFVNIVSYSGAEHAWFAVDEDAEGMRVTLADDGIPFDLTAASASHKDFEDLDAGGMGIGLVRQLATSLNYERDGGRNVLTIG